MDACIRLNHSETVDYKNNTSVLLELVKKAIQKLRDGTGFTVVLLGTKKTGEMFELPQ